MHFRAPYSCVGHRTLPTLKGARQLDLTGQGAFDPILHSAHLGILNSVQARTEALEFLADRHRH